MGILTIIGEAMTRLWIVFALGSAFFAGVTAILAKVGIRNTDSTLATAIRTVVILFFAWLMVFITGAYRTIPALSGKTLAFLTLSGLATGASWLCYFKALQAGPVNKITPIDKSSTLMAMLLAFIFLGETLSVWKAVGMAGIGIGTWLMIDFKIHKTTAPQEPAGRSWMAYALLSAVFAALTSILGKVGVTGIDSNVGTALRTIVVLIMAWVIVFVTRKQDGLKRIDKKSWLFICLSGLTTGLSWLCYYRALQDGPASIVVPVDKLSVLITVLFSFVFLKERLTAKALAGLALLTAGTLILLM